MTSCTGVTARCESDLESLALAGHRHSQQGAAVVSIFENDNSGAFSVVAGDLYGVLHGLGTAVQPNDLLGEITGGDLTQLFSQHDRRLIGIYHQTRVSHLPCLSLNGFNDFRMTVPNIHVTDSACEIDVISSFHILGDRAFGRVNELLGNTANTTGKVLSTKF